MTMFVRVFKADYEQRIVYNSCIDFFV